jgi:putative ABC transport system ATP-binding protein
MTTTISQPGSAEATATDAMVRAVDVAKVYDTGRLKVDALRGVSLTISRGEMVAIMGPSGCGKTTLLNCLSGLDSISSGDVFIEGVSLKTMSDRQRTRYRARRMGFVFQFYNLLAVLTAAENVEMPLLLTGVSTGDARRRALDTLTSSACASARQPPRRTLRRRTPARHHRPRLVNDPAIVWADEPTGDPDSTNAEEIINLMCRLNEERCHLRPGHPRHLHRPPCRSHRLHERRRDR